MTVEEKIEHLLENVEFDCRHCHVFAAMLRKAVEQRNKFAELHYGEHWKSKGIQSFMRLSQDAALLQAAEEASRE